MAQISTPSIVGPCTCHVRPVARHARRGHITSAVKEVFMPALSSTMTEGKITTWLKSPGDKVAKGESLVVVESDKADMEVESFSEGFLGAIVVDEGGVANVGSPIAFVAETEAEIEAAKEKAGGTSSSSNGASAPSAQPAEVKQAEAPKVEAKPEPVAASTAAAPAPSAPSAPPPPPAPSSAPAPAPRADGRVIATPYAKKLAKELGVDLATLGGSGPEGRITASDVQNHRNGASSSAAAPPAPSAPAPSPSPPPAQAPPAEPKAAVSTAGATAKHDTAASAGATTVSELRGTTKPFTGMQSAVAKNMTASLKVPEFRVSYTITTDKLDLLYKRLKPKGVTMTALLAKACGVALAKHPIMFAACTPDGNGITYNESVNVALAVSMPDGGLITPVIQNADSTDIYTISRNWADLVKRARAKQLQPQEYNSLTFTLSNLGMFGADTFDAILPPGTGAILAVGASKPMVTANAEGRIGVERQMICNLTCDHRVIYGADAAEFMATLRGVIENPDQLTF